MAEPLPAATLRLHIDRAALVDNWRALQRLSGSAQAGAAVKADGYGLGTEVVVTTLADAGCREFFVAHWSEVPAVLQHVPAAQICVLHGPGSAQDVAFARDTGIVPVLNSARQAALWRAGGGGRCHVMVDTGINRLGIPFDELGAAGVAGLEVDLLLSHLASADEDSPLNAVQLARFQQMAGTIPARRRSMANSAGIALGSAYHFDLTRPGLSLYGGIARRELAGQIRQVVFPQAAVIQRRTVPAGESVGYNATFTASGPIETATVSIGYADGFLRCRGPRGFVQHGESALPIIGRVSMDMLVVDCSAAPDLREGDFVTIPMHLPDAAEACGLSQYELLTTLGRRFERT